MAIDDLLDEHEQSRRVQDWLRRNGAGLAGGILLGLAAIYGWRWWQQREQTEAARAADAYQKVIDAIDARGAAAGPEVASLPAEGYRRLAALALAEAQAKADEPDKAIATLRGARASEAGPLREVIDLRIARLLLAAGKTDEALGAVSGDSAGVEELRGDVRVAQGRRDDAREAYRKALARTEVGSPQRSLIELKYTQVGGVPTPPTTP